jgi:hypothetical protein
MRIVLCKLYAKKRGKMYHNLKLGVRVLVLVLVLSLALAACSMGQGVTLPDREVTIDAQTGFDAQNSAMAGLMMGGASLDESQFSSLLTELLKANSGENNPVESITAWFEPGGEIYLQVDLKDGVLPAAFGDTLAVAGTVNVSDGQLTVDLNQASAGDYLVEGAVLDPISAQINSSLAGLNVGPVQVETQEGALNLSMSGQ